MERVFYESGKHRIEIEKISGPWYIWLCGRPNGEHRGSPMEYHGLHETLDECLADAECELGCEEPPFTISRDQRTELAR